MAKKPMLLAGCPELEDVRICRPSFEDGMGTLLIPSPNLRTLYLRGIFCGEPVLPDFTSSAHSLEYIFVSEHRVLQRIEFTHQFVRVAQIYLLGCHSLAKITGLECLPSLRKLRICHCSQLQAVENLEALRMLEDLFLFNCPVLMLTSRGLSTLEFLAAISVEKCPSVQFAASDLENMAALRGLTCNVFGNTFKLKNLGSLEELGLVWRTCEGQADEQVSFICGTAHEHVKENAQLMSMQDVQPLLVVGESRPAHLSRLKLEGVRNLVCLHGAHHLLTLKSLSLHSLPQLTCLQGLECLTNLQKLYISKCSAVERLPSLGTLVKMNFLAISDCVNIKSLEGCDKMGLLDVACFDGCENLEHCPIVLQRPCKSQLLSFTGCKFASIKAMVGWVLDKNVSALVWAASVDALTWELTHHLLEKPGERMELAEQLVTTMGMYFTSMLPDLTHDDFFDFQPWVEDLKEIWEYRCESDTSYLQKPKPSFPRGMMEKLGRVPLKGVLQQCQFDAQFCAFVAHWLVEIDSSCQEHWFSRLMNKHRRWRCSLKNKEYFWETFEGR